MTRAPRFRPLIVALALAATALAQGPGSCGFHLDLVTNDTSTYSAIADVPGAPGAQPFGLPPGSLGNPYSAYASPGTQVQIRLEIPGSNLANFAATTPYGPGGVISILYAVGSSNFPLAPFPGSIAPCSFPSFIISILPLSGAIVDGLAVVQAPPIFVPADPGFPASFVQTFNYPVAGAPVVMMQAAVITPGGLLALSNGVSLLTGPSPHQAPIPLAPPPCPWMPSDEGLGVVATPPGFAFYGVPTPSGIARPNGLIEFGPTAGSLCPFDQYSDYACTPGELNVSPRVSVNLVDNDFAVAPAPGIVAGLTVEYCPPTLSTPSRTIVRWKNASPWYAIPGNSILTDYASSVCELWGSDVPGGSPAAASNIVVVRQNFRTGLFNLDVHGGLGIGPGEVGQGFGGPPPACNFIDMYTTWGGWFFTGAPLEAMISNFHPSLSTVLSHLATAFTPIPGAAYRVEAF